MNDMYACWAKEEDNDNFRQLYLQNHLSVKFEILTRSVFESQLQKTLNELFPKNSNFEDIS